MENKNNTNMGLIVIIIVIAVMGLVGSIIYSSQNNDLPISTNTDNSQQDTTAINQNTLQQKTNQI